MSRSILSNEKECLVCGTTYNIHKHHIFYGRANRKLSEKWGCWCYLCARHHNLSTEGVHFNHPLDLKLKQHCQQVFEQDHTRQEFRAIFGKSWL